MPILEFRQDATLYLSQIQLGLKGESIYDNPFWQSAVDESLVGRNFGLYITGRLGGAFGFSLPVTFLFGVFIVSTLFAISVHQLHSVYFCNSKIKLALTLITTIYIFGDFAYRPSPTQWALPVLLLAIFVFLKIYPQSDFKLRVVTTLGVVAILMIVNPFYGIFFIIFSILFIFERFNSPQRIFFSMLGIAALAFLTGQIAQSLITANSNFQLISRWGLLFSHFPGAVKNSVILLVLIIANLVIKRIVGDARQIKITIMLCLAALFTIQQNVVTGIWWEPESHYIYVVVFCTYLTILNVLHSLRKNDLHSVSFRIGGASIATVCLFFLSSNIDANINGILKLNNYGEILQQNTSVRAISQVLSEGTTLKDLITQPDGSGIEVTWAGLIADRKFIWDYQGSLLSGSDNEVLTRYLCSFQRDFMSMQEIPRVEVTQGHRFVNANQHFAKWMFLSRYFNVLERNSELHLNAEESSRINRVLPFVREDRCEKFKNLTATKYLSFSDNTPIISAAS
jgi:hypothetical protein